MRDGEVDGVVGGVVGGVVEAPSTPPPPPPPSAAAAASSAQGAAQFSCRRTLPPKNLLTNPMYDKQYRVALPPALQQAGMRLWAMLKVCVNTEETCRMSRIVKSMDPAVDPQLLAMVRSWRYKPFSRDGRPIPICYNLRYETENR